MPATMEPATKRTKVEDSLSKHPYGFPFPPYELQLAFMDNLYKCLDEGRCRRLSKSPTGTGKSLSSVALYAGSLTNRAKLSATFSPRRPQQASTTASPLG